MSARGARGAEGGVWFDGRSGRGVAPGRRADRSVRPPPTPPPASPVDPPPLASYAAVLGLLLPAYSYTGVDGPVHMVRGGGLPPCGGAAGVKGGAVAVGVRCTRPSTAWCAAPSAAQNDARSRSQ